MKKLDKKGFSAIEGLLILVIVGVLGFVGWYVYHSKNKTDSTYNTAASAQTPASATTTPTNTTTTSKPNPNAGYLVMKEWGLRFKIPSGITGVKYAIHSDIAAFYAKPIGSSVQYRSDYDKFDGDFPAYATGVLYRSTKSTDTTSRPDMTVHGKKVGKYYYYTAWSFSGLATGAACVELYGSSSEANCKAESKAFALVNSNDGNNKALLNTIQLAQ